MKQADYSLPDPLDEFLDAYPSVSKAHAVALTDFATQSVTKAVATEWPGIGTAKVPNG